ncbi:MAG: PHB depolymerase family esterase [Myxococcota bacterium]
MVGWWWISGCGLFGTTQPVDAYIDRISITSNELSRTAFLHVPPGNPLTPRPLWVVLHGSTYDDPARGRAAAARWIDVLNRDAFFVFPESKTYAADPELPWDGPWGSHQYRDLVFLRDLIDTVSKDHAVDPRRVYLVGNGVAVGLTAWAQCVDPKRYAGFAFVDGVIPDVVRERCTPTIRRPVIALHEDPALADGEWRSWLLKGHQCTEEPIATPVAEGPDKSRGKGRQHDCWTVPSIELWTLGPSDHCLPRDKPPCDWVGPAVVGNYFDRFVPEAP